LFNGTGEGVSGEKFSVDGMGGERVKRVETFLYSLE
jgi:hypothetical protein